MKDGILTTFNHPVPDPEQTFANTAITEVPYLDRDDYYRPFEWERGGVWNLLERLFIFRFTYSFRPPSDDREEERNMKAMQLSQFVIQHLVSKVSEDGAVPLVVYFPPKNRVGITAHMLHNAGIEYFDSTTCLTEVSISDAYLYGT